MTIQIIKNGLLGALFICLTGCATLPAQDFKFSLSAPPSGESIWSQEGLAAVGSLTFKFRLNQLAHDAANVNIRLGLQGDKDQLIAVNVSDKSCVGAYSISVRYKESFKVIRTVYFESRIPWEENSTLAILWDKTNRVSITLNGAESKTVGLFHGFSNVGVEVSSGGIDINKLAYRDSSPALN